MGSVKHELPSATYGFIGIGDMGCEMSWNLRKKMPSESKLIVCDVIEERIEKLLTKCKGLGPVGVAASPKEITESCVSFLLLTFSESYGRVADHLRIS